MQIMMCSDQAMMACYPLVGVWRWGALMQSPGKYRIVLVMDDRLGVRHFDAVVDDFGDLVRVP